MSDEEELFWSYGRSPPVYPTRTFETTNAMSASDLQKLQARDLGDGSRRLLERRRMSLA